MPKVNKKYKERRKIQIIKAAFDCFAKKGYSNTSMRDIMTKSKLSSGAIYNYFNSKEEILYELVKSSQTASKNSIEKNLKKHDEASVVEKIVTDFLEKCKDPDAIKGIRTDISIWDAALTDKKLMKLVKYSFESMNSFLAEAVNSNDKRKKLYQGLNKNSVGMVMISLIQGAAIQLLLNPKFDLKAYKKTVLNMIRN